MKRVTSQLNNIVSDKLLELPLKPSTYSTKSTSSGASTSGSSTHLASSTDEGVKSEEPMPHAHSNSTQIMNQRYLQTLAEQADSKFLMGDIADVAALLADG